MPPHKHLGKSESLLILSGTCEHVLFDDQGRITAKRRMGDLASGHDFYLPDWFANLPLFGNPIGSVGILGDHERSVSAAGYVHCTLGAQSGLGSSY